MRRFVMVLVAATVGLALVGCGTSGGDDADKATTTKATPTTKATTTTKAETGGSADDYAKAMATNLSSGDPATDLVLSKDEAACVGPKFVDAITVATLQDEDITPDDVADPSWDTSDLTLSNDQGSAMVDAFEPCGVDIYAKFGEALTGGLTDAQVQCVDEQLAKPDVQALARKLLVVTFAGGEGNTEFEAVLTKLTDACQLPPD